MHCPQPTPKPRGSSGSLELVDGWRFAGPVPLPGFEDHLDRTVIDELGTPELDDSAWTPVVLPHVVAPLSWELWHPRDWEHVWAYRGHFQVPPNAAPRLFLEFDGVMTTAVVLVNGVRLGQHRGGYLPFSFEITDLVDRESENIVAVAVDARFNQNVPPNIPGPAPSSSIDFLQPGGIHRAVRLRWSGETHIQEVSTTHLDVLSPRARRTVAVVYVHARAATLARVDLTLLDGDRVVACTRRPAQELPTGASEVRIELTDLDDVELWDVDRPRLYDLVTTVVEDGTEVDRQRLRTGYREARFETDGFYLNGRRLYLFGVNRHGYFPFAGFAMPDRAHRRDATIIRRDLNSVIVRCAHYPPTASFLDACDELGLLVWEEPPGWQYVGDAEWQEAAVADLEATIARDRHRPSVIVWGARLNEMPDRPELWARMEALAKAHDPTRATSGTMHGAYSRSATFQHDVFSYDDYTTEQDADGARRPALLEPIAGRPYLLAEAVSTYSSPTQLYRRADPAEIQQHQSFDYARAHDLAMADRRFAGLIAWAAFDYQSNMPAAHRGIKTSGLGDVFRNLKPGAAFFRSQVDPRVRPVVELAFTWDPPEVHDVHPFLGARARVPERSAFIATNCDRVEVYLGDHHVGTALPDRARFPNVVYPPALIGLDLRAHECLDLTLHGYLGDDLVLTRRFSGDRSRDTLVLLPDDESIAADGVDATRVVIAVADRFSEFRGGSSAVVDLIVDGPGLLIGDDQLDLSQTGSTAAVWIRSLRGRPGRVVVRASALQFGTATALIDTKE